MKRLLDSADSAWPSDERESLTWLRSARLEPSASQRIGSNGLRSGALGALSSWGATWWFGDDGFEIDAFVASTTPTDERELSAAFERCAAEFDQRWPEARHDAAAGHASWHLSGAILELDLVAAHPEAGVVQLHLRPRTRPN